MRAFCTSLMALLVTAALFWGNCYSCPQVLLAASAHSCCHRTNAPKTECQTQSMRSFVKAEKSSPVSVMPVTVATVAPEPRFAAAAFSPELPRIEPSPLLTVPLRI